MVLPVVAGAAQAKAAGPAATAGRGTSLHTAASAGRIPGAPAAATAGRGVYSGSAAPPQPPPIAEEGAVLHGQERRRAAAGSSSSSSAEEPPLTPALQLAIANELITRFAMAQEKRALSDAELSLVKFLLDRIPVLEAAAGACGGDRSPRWWGFAVGAPVRLAWMRKRSVEGRGADPRRGPSSPSTEEPGPLTPALQLEIAKEVVGRLNSLVQFLEDRVPGLKAASGVRGGGAARFPPKAAPSGRARVPAKASRAAAASLSPAANLRHPGQVAAPSAAIVSIGWEVVSGRAGEEGTNATSALHNNVSEHNVSHEHHTGQGLPCERESLPSGSSTKEPLSPTLQLEIAKEVITRLTMSQEMGTLSADEHSLVKFMKDRISGLGAEAASGVSGGGATPPPPNVAPSDPAHVPAEASHHVAVSPSPVPTPLHPPFHQVPPLAAAHVTVGQQVVTEHLGKEDAHATSRVPNKMSEANANHKHHGGKELPSEHESLPSSSRSSREEPLTPADQLAVANVLITQFAMVQEKRMLFDDELCLVKFLLDRIPVLEATLRESGGQLSLRRGFRVAHPVQWAWPRRANIGWRAVPCHCPSSSEEPLAPEIQLEIASEVITHLAMEQETRMLSAGELSLIMFLKDRIPDLEAVVRSGATPFPSKVAPSHSRARAKALLAIAAILSPAAADLLYPGLSALMVHPLSHQDSTPAANVTVGQQVVNRHLDVEDAHATSDVVSGSSSSLSSSSKEPLTPEIQLEIAKEVISQLVKAQEKRMLSANEHSLIKFLEGRIPGLEAILGVCNGETQSLSKVASSCLVRAKAQRVIMATFSAVDQGRPVPFAPMVHPLSQQDATPAAHVTIGQQVVTEHSGKEDARAISHVTNKMSEANTNHKHHGGKELPSEHESLPSSSLSSKEEPLTPADQLAVANELITQFAMAQEKRMLSDDELCLVKFLLDRIPVLEATLRDSGGQLSLRKGFMVAPPVQWAWPRRANIGRRAVPCHRPSSSEEPLAPEIQLEIASEVITHLAVEQETRMLSAGELTLIMFLKDRIPDLEAVVRGGATLFPSKVAPSHSRARAKALLAIATILSPAVADLLYPGLSALMVHPLSHQDATLASHVTVGQQVVNRHLDEEDAHATSVVVSGSSSSPSSSSKEPLTPEIQLEIAKEVITQLVKAQEKRMLSADEHSLIKFLEGRIPGLEAVLGVCNGETQSLSKVASSCLMRAKAQRVIMATFSAVDQGRPVPFVPMVHPLSQQDATPAAHVTVGRQVVTRHSGEEDAHATSAVHKMSDANVSHEHHRGQELTSEHESFSEKLNSGCDQGVVTEKSSTTIAPEMVPPSDGDNTAESSGVSNRWGTAPDVEGFDDFGLPDDLGLY